MEKGINNWERDCPSCGILLKYKYSQSFCNAKNKNVRCTSCSSKESHNRPDVRKKLSECQKGLQAGDKNPMFGKKHTSLIQKSISNNTKKYYNENPESRPMKGKSLLSVWEEKYGAVEAKRLNIEKNEKLSNATRGNKNPMFGKPCPSNSGRGIKGYYKTHFFRSLMELSYILTLERFNIPFCSAEKKEFKISYISLDGNNRTYVADFLVANKYLVECKPKSLIRNKDVQIKALAAIEFCNKNGLFYKIVSPSKIKQSLLDKLLLERKVILI